MIKKLLLLFVIFLVGCGGPSNNDTKETGISVSAPEQINEDAHPLYSDFRYEITEAVNSDGYGKATVTNNSQYPTKYIKFNLEDKEGIENIINYSDSLLPGETSKETTIFFSAGSKNIDDYTPIWTEFNYLDEDKNENIMRYDYKLDVYDKY